jgi:hypothetical protein
LLKVVPGLILIEAALLHNVVKQLPARHELNHHENVRGRVDDLVQADNVRVGEALEVGDLAPHLAAHLQLHDLGAVEDLDGHIVASFNVLGHCQAQGWQREMGEWGRASA